MAKRWSKTEVAHLKRHAGSKSLDELAQRLHTDAPTVRKKLEELGLLAGGPTSGPDPAVASYEEGLAHLHAGRFAGAAAAFERVIVESDTKTLTDRARQHLAICRRKTAEAVDVEPYVAAIVEKNRGNYAAAAGLVAKVGKPDSDERAAYLAASLAALGGDSDAALDHLQTAVRLEPRNRVHAYHDPDFASLRGREEFQRLLAAG